ncbi:hypothetical protein DFH29DRAFT_1028245 [Suillus ampliporus]|nr:hypothetical protein DFH29DRAFT_1028245 [Suillus ampliporus]
MTYYAGRSTVDVPKAHPFYSLDGNFTLDNLTMASMLSISQRYYVPRRIHEMHRPRSIGKRPKKTTLKTSICRAFEQDKVLLEVFSQTRAPFATLCAKLLDEQKIFSRERPTTLDVYLASHILLLLDPPFQNQSLRSILRLIRSLSNPPKTMESRMDEAHLQFHRMRWTRMWFALAFGGVACYVAQLWIKGKGDHRVLICFQMTRSMTDLMEKYLIYRQYKYLVRLDGPSKLEDRRDMVMGWHTRPDVFIFILSMRRVGGLGINLTAVNTVIFYDH